ncbi:hypothetical protein KP509_24G059900 [Ceratopteris richardii]|uniref:non-specific serine/threonine protein kinase n=1 Tax=Ceratopteris richardii TaxID=49495 RepID=A0A8T2RV15_CERRI|nr:hypothetical protein KP509_24G059900 [Ceratopteris richardii]
MPYQSSNILHLIDNFIPVGLLGHGNVGTVILLLSKHSDTPFALKVARAPFSKKQRSHVESDILSSLHHSFLQTLHGYFEFGDHNLLLLDFCSGGDLNVLRQRQPEKRFSETAARFYAAEVVLALEHMHKLGIVYRDLKPENILLQGTGHIMLTDFDLSLRLPAPLKSLKHVKQMVDTIASRGPALYTLKQHILAETERERLTNGCCASGVVARSDTRSDKEGDGHTHRQSPFPWNVVDGAAGCHPCKARRVGGFIIRRLRLLGLNEKMCRRKAISVPPKECNWTRRGCSATDTKHHSRPRKVNTSNMLFSQYSSQCLPRLQRKNSPKSPQRIRICLVGTEEYVAPEVLKGEESSFSMDWWSFGVFLYEMIYGSTPFKGATSEMTLCNILEREPVLPGTKTAAKHLISQLLVKDPPARLGTFGGADAIKQHPYFRGMKWESLSEICRPPFIPEPICFTEIKQRSFSKDWWRGSSNRLYPGDEQSPDVSSTRKSWLHDIMENIQSADLMPDQHEFSTQFSHSSSSVGFVSSSADGGERELRRQAHFSSSEWSSTELDAGRQPADG